MYIFLGLILVLPACFAQRVATPTKWARHNYPNPRTEPEKCGRYRSKPSNVCDPNGILTRKEADTLDWLITGILKNDTNCPCSSWACEQNSKGFHISVALVKQMKRDAGAPNTNNAKQHDAKRFAHFLESTQWNFGQCDEDVVIFYSQEDNVLFTMVGTTTRLFLPDYLILEISNGAGYHFRPGESVSSGLFKLIRDYRLVFRNEYHRSTGPRSEAVIGGSAQLTVTVTSTLLLLFIAFQLS